MVNLRILFIGDIVGECGLEYIENNLSRIQSENKINLVIANAENITNGRGLKKRDYQRLLNAGVSVITMGNHTFSQKEIREYIDDSKIVRPANFNTNIGKGYIGLDNLLIHLLHIYILILGNIPKFHMFY